MSLTGLEKAWRSPLKSEPKYA